MMKIESVFSFFEMAVSFIAIRSPEGAKRIPGLFVPRMTTRNALRSFRATYDSHETDTGGEHIRIISARRATKIERKIYEQGA
jgi:hypothetical protein